MEKDTFDILSDAISDVGYWRWWIAEDDRIQLEFGGVQLLNSDTLDKNSTSAIIALRFSENVLLKFYDNEAENQWHIQLQEDKIEPFTVDYDFFRFNNPDSINEIEKEYKNQIVIKESEGISELKNVLAFKAGDVAVITGGNDFCVVDANGKIDEETIWERSRLWGIFWRDYWKKRDTDDPYNKDYACEATIPVKE